jgi:hypothetical protein
MFGYAIRLRRPPVESQDVFFALPRSSGPCGAAAPTARTCDPDFPDPRPRGKAVKLKVLIKRPGNAEPEKVEAVARRQHEHGRQVAVHETEPTAARRTEDPRKVAPGAAADDAAARAIFSFAVCPRRAIVRSILVAVVIFLGDHGRPRGEEQG